MSRLAYPNCRPSGIEWLGVIPEHWDVRRLKYSAALMNQKVEGDQSGLPYTGLEHIESWTGKRLAPNGEPSSDGQANLYRCGDVLFGKLRPYLAKVLAAEGDGICSGELLVLRPNATSQQYLRDYLLNRDFISVVDSSTYGTKMPRASWDFIGSLPVLVPPLDEQLAISSFLDRETARTDALIEKKQRQIQLLRERRSAIISHAVTKGLNPAASMKNSGVEWLGEIPEHWKILPLKFTLRSGSSSLKTGPFGSQLLSSEMVSGTKKVYNQRNVLDCDFRSGDNYVTESKYQELQGFTVFPSDVLVTTRGTIGRCALVPEGAELGILHPCLMRIQTNAAILLPQYLSTLIQDGGIVLLQLRLISNATTIDVVYSESLRSVRLPVPPVGEQEQILSWLSKAAAKDERLLTKAIESMDVLREYRMALVTAAVTGKIDVRCVS